LVATCSVDVYTVIEADGPAAQGKTYVDLPPSLRDVGKDQDKTKAAEKTEVS
jgi:hypothetical protein